MRIERDVISELINCHGPRPSANADIRRQGRTIHDFARKRSGFGQKRVDGPPQCFKNARTMTDELAASIEN